MKELSIEQKAKAYDKAIAYAKILLKTIGNATLGNLVFKNEFENMFPELKESEDERIRKALKEYFINSFQNNGVAAICGVHIKDILAWLEKQGEQKSTLPKWKYKNDNTPLLRDSLILNKYGCVAKSPSGALVSDVWVIDYDELAKLPKEDFEKQDEQKSADKIEPKFKVGDKIISTISNIPYYIVKVRDEYYLTDVGCIIMFNAQDNFELVEQKSNNKIEPSAQNKSWSEEDENIRLRLIDYLYGKSRLTKDREDGISWLRTLKDRVQLQPKQEWSEEDYNEIETIACHLDNIDNESMAEVLRNIRDKYYSHPHWKPSNEQILAINTAINTLGKGTINGKYLIELQEQLKKLMEE